MRPTNLSQVFVINNATNATGTVFDKHNGSAGFNALAASANKGGVWTFESSSTGTHTYAGTAANLLSTTPSSTFEYFQITQGTTGAYPIATPIIRPKQIRRIKYVPYVASQRHQVAATFSATVPTGNTYLVKIALRNMPISYEAFANPTNTALDLSAGGKIFPLIGNFAAGRNIFQVTEIAAGTTAANCGIAVTNAIQANTLLNNMFTVSDNGSGVVTVLARHAGVIFDLVAFNSVTDTNVIGTPTVTGWDAGTGNYWQAISDEKQQRSRYGNFNRMYFPTTQTDYSQVSGNYDVIEVSYDHGHPSDTGIARAGEWNTVRMYITANASTAWATAGIDWDTWFGITAGTASEVYY